MSVYRFVCVDDVEASRDRGEITRSQALCAIAVLRGPVQGRFPDRPAPKSVLVLRGIKAPTPDLGWISKC